MRGLGEQRRENSSGSPTGEEVSTGVVGIAGSPRKMLTKEVVPPPPASMTGEGARCGRTWIVTANNPARCCSERSGQRSIPPQSPGEPQGARLPAQHGGGGRRPLGCVARPTSAAHCGSPSPTPLGQQDTQRRRRPPLPASHHRWAVSLPPGPPTGR